MILAAIYTKKEKYATYTFSTRHVGFLCHVTQMGMPLKATTPACAFLLIWAVEQ